MKKKLTETFKGKKVFLTGHTGFKGSWMLKILEIIGANVKGYSLEPEFENGLYNLIKGDELCDSVIADICDIERLSKEINNFQPDFVFHFAAQPLVRLSYEIPSTTFNVNVMGTVNLLEAVRLCQKEISVIIITTDKVYENLEWVYPYRETDRLGGIDPYSASKACSELVVSSYINSFFNPNVYNQHKKVIGVCRAGNVIGGGDWSKDRIIPDIIKAIFNNDIINIRNPKAIRPWQHVLEPLFGYLLLAMNLKLSPKLYSGAYNFGPNSNDVFSVEELVNLCIKIFERGDYKLSDEINSKHEAGILKLDISKAFEKIEWKPLYNAEEAITKTIDWYKIFHNDFSRVNEFTEKQINQYLDVI